MLLEEKVEIIWNGRNKQHFVDKGYSYTKQREPFMVKVSDLQETSHVKIKVSCDCCGKIGNPQYRDYIKRTYDEYLCSDCALKKYGLKTRNKNLVKNTMSFADYCNQNIDKDFINKYWSSKNKENPFEIPYLSQKDIYIKCQNKEYHEDYKTNCYRFVHGTRCPECSSRKINKLDSLGYYLDCNNMADIWSDKNKISKYNVSLHNGKKAFFKCKCGKHDDYQRRIADAYDKNFECPQCVSERDESILQEKVRLFFNELGLKTLHEYNCNILPINPKTNYPLPFDNEVVDIRLICEVNGIQHYHVTGFSILSSKKNNTTPNDELLYIQWKDKIKREYALSQGYEYLEIPYTSIKNDYYKELILNKLSDMEDLYESKN